MGFSDLRALSRFARVAFRMPSTAINFVGYFGRAVTGATAIEYSLIAALIAVGMIAGASKIDPGFDKVEGKISEAINLAD